MFSNRVFRKVHTISTRNVFSTNVVYLYRAGFFLGVAENNLPIFFFGVETFESTFLFLNIKLWIPMLEISICFKWPDFGSNDIVRTGIII